MENNPLKSERVKKFLEKFYPSKTDKLGLPSLITVNDRDHTLTCSIDRSYLKRTIIVELIKNFGYDKEQSNTIAEFYCDEKYEIYKKIILSL
jgi:hypothetical protein